MLFNDARLLHIASVWPVHLSPLPLLKVIAEAPASPPPVPFGPIRNHSHLKINVPTRHLQLRKSDRDLRRNRRCSAVLNF